MSAATGADNSSSTSWLTVSSARAHQFLLVKIRENCRIDYGSESCHHVVHVTRDDSLLQEGNVLGRLSLKDRIARKSSGRDRAAKVHKSQGKEGGET